MNLTINNSSTSVIDTTVCDTLLWSLNGLTYTSSIIDTVLTIDSSGCTETNILNLTVYNSSNSILDTIVCNSYNWNGGTYTQSVTDTFVTTNCFGCDSTLPPLT